MDGISNSVALGVSIVKQAVERDAGLPEGAPIEDRARACFEAVWEESNVWFASSDNERYIIGCGALAMLCSDEERDRIRAELDFARGLNAAGGGIPVDIGTLMERFGEEGPIGLQKLFFDAKPKA
jgi:hypothetical protein